MPIRELLGALETSASAERRGLLDGAQAEADAILAAAERDRTAQLDAALEQHRARRRAAANARFAGVERDQRRLLLLARERLLRRLRAELEALLPELAIATTDDQLGQLVRAAIDCTGDGSARLYCAPKLVERARRHAGSIAVEHDDTIATGVRVAIDDGRVTVDSTLAALLERWWPRLRIAALDIAEELGAPQEEGHDVG